MNAIITYVKYLFEQLNVAGSFLPQPGLRFLLAYEFWESGVEKYTGKNWTGGIQAEFPFPFNHVPVEISWFLSTWSELIARRSCRV